MPGRTLVIGGGVLGVELPIWNAFGSKIDMVKRSPLPSPVDEISKG